MTMEALLDRATVGTGKLPIPMPPQFNNPAEERAYIKSRLAAAFRIFAHFGFDDGLAGHISVRDPERTDCFWVNPVGVHFSKRSNDDDAAMLTGCCECKDK